MKKVVALPVLALVLVAYGSLTSHANEKQTPEDRDWSAYIYDGDTTLEMNKRCREAYETLEQRMGEVFTALLADQDEKGEELAKANQEDWQRYALSKRAFDADIYRGGSLSGPTAGVSYIHELCRRINELRQAIEDRRPR